MQKRKFSNRLHVPLVLVLAAAVFASAQTSKRQQERPATGGLRAFVDPVTGALREPEQAEVSAMSVAAAAAAANAVEQPITSATGVPGMLLGEDQMTYAVAKIGPDGKVKFEEATGKDNAAAIVLAPSGKDSSDVR